jgi:hypothetical protein
MGPVSQDVDTDWFARVAGGRIVEVGDSVTDPSGTLEAWMKAFGCMAALVRPDRYVFGVAESHDDIGRLLDRLRDVLEAEFPLSARNA